MRKIVQIAFETEGDKDGVGSTLYGLCNDGTILMWEWRSKCWSVSIFNAPIPQPEAKS